MILLLASMWIASPAFAADVDSEGEVISCALKRVNWADSIARGAREKAAELLGAKPSEAVGYEKLAQQAEAAALDGQEQQTVFKNLLGKSQKIRAVSLGPNAFAIWPANHGRQGFLIVDGGKVHFHPLYCGGRLMRDWQFHVGAGVERPYLNLMCNQGQLELTAEKMPRGADKKYIRLPANEANTPETFLTLQNFVIGIADGLLAKCQAQDRENLSTAGDGYQTFRRECPISSENKFLEVRNRVNRAYVECGTIYTKRHPEDRNVLPPSGVKPAGAPAAAATK